MNQIRWRQDQSLRYKEADASRNFIICLFFDSVLDSSSFKKILIIFRFRLGLEIEEFIRLWMRRRNQESRKNTLRLSWLKLCRSLDFARYALLIMICAEMLLLIVFAVNVNVLEKTHDWIIIFIAESVLTMIYNRTLQLFFISSSFVSEAVSLITSENASISLIYIINAHIYHPQPLTTEKRFFLQMMRAQLQCLQ